MPPAHRLPRPTLYLIEHSRTIRHRQLGWLTRIAGIRVIASGASATNELRCLIDYRPDIVVLGLRTASTGTLQDVRKIRSALPDSVLFVLVDIAAPPLRRACLKAGGDYCLDRTLEVEALRRVLARLALAAAAGDAAPSPA